MSQAGKLVFGGTGGNSLVTTIVADIGQAQGKDNILNAVGGQDINTSAPSTFTVQVNLDDIVMVNESEIGNLQIHDSLINSINTNGNIVLNPAAGSKVTYDNAGINPSSFLYFGTDGRLYSTNSATDGQILIGSDSGVPVAANITAGDNVTITNGTNSIKISTNASGTGFVSEWVVIDRANYPTNQNTTYQMQPNTGYIVNWYSNGAPNPAVLTLTLPSLSALNIGDFFSIICNGAYGCDPKLFTCYPNSVYIDPSGYAFIAPYQSVDLVTSRIYPVTYGGGGAGGKPTISFVYSGTDINLTGTNQPVFEVVHAMGVWKS